MNIATRITVGTIFAFIFSALPLIFYAISDSWERYYLESTPREEFFHYISTLPIKDQFRIGEDITLASILEVYKPLTFYWNDRLWCDLDDDDKGFHLVGRHIDELYSEPIIRTDDNPSRWDYTGRLPNATGDCYILSVIDADVGQGVIKTQTIQSGPFEIIE